jgi:hypothetical protein
MSCTFCKSVLEDMVKPHTEDKCPLRRSYYCSACAVYGHLMSDCPAKPQAIYTEPAYLEQLISPCDLIEFKITSKTPIQAPKREFKHQLIEIRDNEMTIKTYLAMRGIKVQEGYKDALYEYARCKNKRVIFIK